MKLIRIKFSHLTTCNNDQFGYEANETVQALQAAPTTFPTPPISTVVLAAAVQDYIAKNTLADSDNGNHNDRNARDAQRLAVYEMLVANGLYVLSIANLQETYQEKVDIVQLGGYTVASDTHNPVEPVAVTNLKVAVPTTPGDRTVKARWRRGKCHSFIVQGTKGNPSSPAAEWKALTFCAKAQCELTLEPGEWAIRIIGLYSAGQAPASTDVSFVIN